MDGTLLFLGEFFSAEDQDHTSASGNCHKSRGEGSASRAGVFRFIRIIYRWIASIGFLLIWEEAVLLIWIFFLIRIRGLLFLRRKQDVYKRQPATCTPVFTMQAFAFSSAFAANKNTPYVKL